MSTPATSVASPVDAAKQTLSPFRLRRHADYQLVYQASRKHFSASMSYFLRVRAASLEGSGASASPIGPVGPASPVGIVQASGVARRSSPEKGCGLPEVIGPRVGLTVGKVMGKAVDRNRIKRRMRAAVRLHLPILHGAPQTAIDLVLHPRKSVIDMEFAALEREIVKVFSQVAAMASGRTPGLGSPGQAGPRGGRRTGKQSTPLPGSGRSTGQKSSSVRGKA